MKHINYLFYGFLITYCFILLSTEILSLFSWINFAGVSAAWTLFAGSVIFVLVKYKIPKPTFRFNKSYLFLIPIIFVLTVTLFIGIVYPPNNVDSMTYHMARVMHWINNENVEFYQTLESRQLYQFPLAEYAIMHLQILTGGDYFANCVQWMSFVFCIMTIFLITLEVTQNLTIAGVATIITSTIPMAILQSSSTQNDLVVSGFIVALILCLIRLQKEISFKNIIFAGISLGLAIATKGTALIFCLAVGISFSVPLLYKIKQKAVLPLVIIVIIGFMMNGFFFYRTYQKYGNILPTSESTIYKNTGNPIKNTYQNAVRNIMMHSDDMGYELNKYKILLVRILLNDDMSNSNSTWGGTYFMISADRHEDLAGNKWHIILILLSLIFIFKMRKDISLPMVYSLVIGFLLFCLILKWQPWGGRLQLPLFILSCPLIAAFVYNMFDKYGKVFIVVMLIVFSMPYLFENESRNISSFDWLKKSRNELMFNNNPDVYNKYLDIIEKTKNDKYIDAKFKEFDWEYPLWKMSGKEVR